MTATKARSVLLSASFRICLRRGPLCPRLSRHTRPNSPASMFTIMVASRTVECLAASASPAVTKLCPKIHRGLAPQVFTAPAEYPTQTAALKGFGTHSIELRRTSSAAHETAEALLTCAQPAWTTLSTHTYTVSTPAELRAFNARALALLPVGGTFRHRWLTQAPRLFPRDRHRVLCLTPEEHAALAEPEHFAQPATSPHPAAATKDS